MSSFYHISITLFINIIFFFHFNVQNNFLFYSLGGVGISDQDSAMFVRRNETSCLNVNVLAGPAPIIDNVFAVRFASNSGSDALQLCYQFQSEPFVLYPNVEMVEQKSLVDGYYDNLRRVDAQFTFNLDGNIEDYPAGSPERTTLLISFINDLVRALNLKDSSRISILSITSGKYNTKSEWRASNRVYGKHCRLTFLFLLPPSTLFHWHRLVYSLFQNPQTSHF